MNQVKNQETMQSAKEKATKFLIEDLKPSHFADVGGASSPEYRRFYAKRKWILAGNVLGKSAIIDVMDFLGFDCFFKKSNKS